MFHIDPLAVLKSTDKEWAVRLAAYEVIQEDEEKAAAEARSKAKKK